MMDRVWRTRIMKAVAITFCLIMCVPAIDALGNEGDGADALEQKSAGIDARSIIGNGDPDGFVRRVNQAATPKEAALPAVFAQEVGLPRGARDVRVDSGGAVIGCSVALPAEDVADAISEQMAARGWREVPLGSVEGATYVKDAGSCSWSLVSCTQIGDKTAVVYRCVYR